MVTSLATAYWKRRNLAYRQHDYSKAHVFGSAESIASRYPRSLDELQRVEFRGELERELEQSNEKERPHWLAVIELYETAVLRFAQD